jgi:LPXTG-motif cell wall-anchored protein
VKRLLIAIAVTLGVVAVLPSPTQAWGNGQICWQGQTYTFQDEPSYYIFLFTHPGATEGTCVTTTTSTTTTVPATTTTVAQTTTTEATTSTAPTTTASTTTDSSTSTTVIPSSTVVPTTVSLSGGSSGPSPQTPSAAQTSSTPTAGGTTVGAQASRTELPATGAMTAWTIAIALFLILVGAAMLHARRKVTS